MHIPGVAMAAQGVLVPTFPGVPAGVCAAAGPPSCTTEHGLAADLPHLDAARRRRVLVAGGHSGDGSTGPREIFT
jgi:hypothetical protein